MNKGCLHCSAKADLSGQVIRMDEIQLSLDKNKLKARRREAEENSKREYDEEVAKTYLLFQEKLNIQEFEIKENSLWIYGELESGLGNISLDVHLEDSDLIDLIAYAVKKLNKYKSIIETMKSI